MYAPIKITFVIGVFLSGCGGDHSENSSHEINSSSTEKPAVDIANSCAKPVRIRMGQRDQDIPRSAHVSPRMRVTLVDGQQLTLKTLPCDLERRAALWVDRGAKFGLKREYLSALYTDNAGEYAIQTRHWNSALSKDVMATLTTYDVAQDILAKGKNYDLFHKDELRQHEVLSKLPNGVPKRYTILSRDEWKKAFSPEKYDYPNGAVGYKVGPDFIVELPARLVPFAKQDKLVTYICPGSQYGRCKVSYFLQEGIYVSADPIGLGARSNPEFETRAAAFVNRLNDHLKSYFQ